MKKIGNRPPVRTGMKNSKEHNKKISESNKGKKLTQETKDKIARGHKGKKLSEKHKKKLGAAKKKPVLQFALDGKIIKEWAGMVDVVEEFGDNSRYKVIKCCKGLPTEAYGFFWKFKNNE